MFKNPIYFKELKINARSKRLALTIFFFNLFLAVIVLFLYFLLFSKGIPYRRVDTADILFLYWMITCIEICSILFLVPSFTAGAISGEREKQTLEILLTTKLSYMQIVLGKLAASLSSLLLLIISGMPILAFVFSVGGITLLDLLQFQFLLFITAVFLGSIGIYFSCRFQQTTRATAYTYGSILVLLAGTVLGVFSGYRLIGQVGGMNFAYLLLINPGVTFLSSLTEQYGHRGEFKDVIGQFGGCSAFVLEHWFGVSILVQIALSCLILFRAGKRLNPNQKN